MTSESTRKVIDQLNAAVEVANAELMALDSDKQRSVDLYEKMNDEIDDYKEKLWNHRCEIVRKNHDYEVTMILMILSLVFGFSAIGYAVWV